MRSPLDLEGCCQYEGSSSAITKGLLSIDLRRLFLNLLRLLETSVFNINVIRLTLPWNYIIFACSGIRSKGQKSAKYCVKAISS